MVHMSMLFFYLHLLYYRLLIKEYWQLHAYKGEYISLLMIQVD